MQDLFSPSKPHEKRGGAIDHSQIETLARSRLISLRLLREFSIAAISVECNMSVEKVFLEIQSSGVKLARLTISES